MAELVNVTTGEFLIRLQQEPVNGVVDLSNLDLCDVNMRDRHVREALYELTRRGKSDQDNPFFIDLSNSNISGCGLYDLDFSHFVLTGVNAERAIFNGSDFTETKFDSANVNYADFRYTNLSFAKFYKTSIIGTNFTGADMRTAKGFNLERAGKETIERLGVCRYISYAQLPPKVEVMRSKIQQAINRNFPRKNTKALEILEKTSAPEAEYASSEW